jgi:hypothetical protein
MNFDTLEGRIRVEPDSVEWTPRTHPGAPTLFNIEFRPEIGQTYTITLLAGAEDVYGNAIETDYSWSFSLVEPPPPQLRSYLVVRDYFLTVTNAYREDTRLAMVTWGQEDFISNFALYRAGDIVTAIQAVTSDVGTYEWYRAWTDALLSDAEQLRSWQQTFNGGGERATDEVLLASTDGGQLEPGLYFLEADEYRSHSAATPVVINRVLLAVSTAVLTVRRGPNEILVWVTDMNSGAPVADTTVNFYARTGTTLSALTDADGIARLPMSTPLESGCEYGEYCSVNEFALISAEDDDVYGLWYSERVLSTRTQVGNLYTERRVYRPGDTVYFRGVLRDKDDMTFTIPVNQEVQITVCPYYGCDSSSANMVANMTVPVSEWGTINGSFALPSNLEPANYYIQTDWGSEAFRTWYCYNDYYDDVYCEDAPSGGTVFTVATFDTPEFEISAAPAAPEGMQGEPLGVIVDARLYNGGALRGVPVAWEIQAHAGTFRHENYGFGDALAGSNGLRTNYSTRSTANTDIPAIVTGMDGTAVIPTEQIVADVPLTVNVGIDVTEGSESHRTRVSFFLHSSDVYVGLRHPMRQAEQGSDIQIEAITVTPQRETVGGQVVRYTIEHLREEERNAGQYGYNTWVTVVTEVASDTFTTAADGTAVVTFPAAEPGRYRLRAVTQDQQGRSHSSTIEVRVGDEPLPNFQVATYADKTFRITPDEGIYQPGDTALLQIRPPESSGTLLLTVQRQNIQRVFVLQIESSEPIVFELPLGFEDTPNVFVAGTFVQGMISPDDSPSYATAHVNLGVRPTHRILKVEVTSSTAEAAPGETVMFDVRVTDTEGNPVAAEVGMALVDDAILSLAPAASLPLAETFYSYQWNRVLSLISLGGLVDDLTDSLYPPGLGGGGGGACCDLSTYIDPRDNFVTTPLWLPNVVTDENGFAQVSVVMPDNLTRWRLDVRAVSLETQVGQAELELVTVIPFFVRPQTPRFLVVGDTVELATIAHNETDTAQTVTASIVTSGVTLLQDADQQITLPPRSQQRIAWRATVNDVTAVEVAFSVGNADVSDAALPDLPDNRIPVYRFLATDTVATAGMIDTADTRTEIIIPPDNALTSELRLSLASSLIDTTALALDAYPPREYETMDRLIGRLIINVGLYRTGRYDSLAAEIEADLGRLFEAQSTPGGWGWIAKSNLYDRSITRVALIALDAAIAAGFIQAESMRTNNCSLINGWDAAILPDATFPTSGFNDAAYAQYGLALCGQPDLRVMERLVEFRTRLSPIAKGWLLLSIPDSQPELRQIVVDDLLGSASFSATGMHWQGLNSPLWDTDTLTTAVVLRALTQTQPEFELLPNVVRWLTIARGGERWSTPLESGWAATALVDYALAVEGQAPTYALDVQLGDAQLLSNAASVGLNEQLMLPLSVGAHRLALTRGAGEGVLYYTAVLDARLPATDTPPIARGITVLREYLNVHGAPVDSVALGESVFVRLTVIASQDISYFVLEDPLPAGLIADDPALIQTNQSGLSVTRALSQADVRWFFNSNAFQRSVYTNTQVTFYADALPRGTYIVTYEARAGAVGSFQVMPTHVYAAMMPDIFGRSAGQVFTVRAG